VEVAVAQKVGARSTEMVDLVVEAMETLTLVKVQMVQ
jgi:hypothetical protein